MCVSLFGQGLLDEVVEGIAGKAGRNTDQGPGNQGGVVVCAGGWDKMRLGDRVGFDIFIPGSGEVDRGQVEVRALSGIPAWGPPRIFLVFIAIVIHSRCVKQ